MDMTPASLEQLAANLQRCVGPPRNEMQLQYQPDDDEIVDNLASIAAIAQTLRGHRVTTCHIMLAQLSSCQLDRMGGGES